MALTWEVGVQEQKYDIGPDGKAQEVMVIPVIFNDGSSFQLKIPVAQYNWDSVLVLIRQRANEHAAIAGLREEV